MGSEERTRDVQRVELAVQGYALLVSSEAGVAAHLVPQEGSLSVGRDDTCDVWIDDASVSRRHALVHAGSPPTIEDLGSRNGTRVRGVRLREGERATLPVGTVVELGSAMLVAQAASQALATHRARRPPARAEAAGLVVADPTMKRIYELLDVIAPSVLSVLVLGETGVGKEVFAAELHRRSPRAESRFLALNCAALADTLLESELFGHERGAFTGAVRPKPGLFEAADGGTVLLDEIGELPLPTQAKLLRVLETGEILRLGSVTPKRVDVRFVAATHRDLPARVADGTFRADLYFRINGITVTIPPLRERPLDVTPLARMLVDKVCARTGASAPAITPAAAAALEAHTWPGNARELRNVVERAVLLARGGPIGVEHVVLEPDPTRRAATVGAPPSQRLRDQVDHFEADRIRSALAQAGGHQGKAADLLGISRRTLIDKLNAYGIERPRKR